MILPVETYITYNILRTKLRKQFFQSNIHFNWVNDLTYAIQLSNLLLNLEQNQILCYLKVTIEYKRQAQYWDSQFENKTQKLSFGCRTHTKYQNHDIFDIFRIMCCVFISAANRTIDARYKYPVSQLQVQTMGCCIGWRKYKGQRRDCSI